MGLRGSDEEAADRTQRVRLAGSRGFRGLRRPVIGFCGWTEGFGRSVAQRSGFLEFDTMWFED